MDLRIRSVVVNNVHVWECSACGCRWLPSQTPPARCQCRANNGTKQAG